MRGAPCEVGGHQFRGGVEVVGRLERQRPHPLELATGQPDQRPRGRQLDQGGDAQLAQGRLAGVPADGPGHLGDEPAQHVRAVAHRRAVGVGQQRGASGRAGVTDAACSPSAFSAGRHEPGVERARRRPAAPPGPGSAGTRRAAASASRGPAATTWPAPLRLAGSSPSSSRRASTSSGFPPSTALMPVGSNAHAAAISRPRTAASATAASGRQHARDGGRGQLADGVARGDQGHGQLDPGGQQAVGEQRRGHHQGLGHRGVLDLLGVRGGAQALQVQAGGVRPAGAAAASASRVVDQPRSEHAGRLRALTGREQGDHARKLHRRHGRAACRFPPNSAAVVWRFAPILQAGDDEGGSQHEGITRIGGGVAGDLADPAQPVPHGVGVDVERARAGLERRRRPRRTRPACAAARRRPPRAA